MNEKEFLKSIGINNVGYFTKDKAYAIDLDNANKWGDIHSILYKNEDLEEDSSVSSLTMHEAHITYSTYYPNDDNFQLNLIADFDEEIYTLVVKKI